MSDFKVVRNITIVNTRMITPITRDFGAQYSILASGSELEQIGVKTNEDGSGWINSNATYANGDSIAAIPMIDRSKRPVTTELGAGSEVELAFKVVTTPKGTYYNLAAVKVMKMVKPFSVFDMFDEAADETQAVLNAF
jgi:hypothetical protein